MSEFAFFRFRSNNMLTQEEEEHKEEIIQLTEEVLQAKGIQCDASISKIPEEELIEILEKVRELRRRKKKKQSGTEVLKEEDVYIYKGDKMETTKRRLSMLGIGTLCFGISLFVLRIPVRTIIVFFIIGVPLVALWLYVDAKSKQPKKITTDTSTTTQVCICSICKHEEAKTCFQENCACCLLTKGNTVIGHSVNPLH